jgi:hypothetical protein
MAFEELETVTRGNEPPQATVTYDYAQKKGERVRKADAKPRLTISIPTTLSSSETFLTGRFSPPHSSSSPSFGTKPEGKD